MQIGVIGCGVISSAYLRGLARSSLIKVKSIADIDQEAARAQAKAFNVSAATVEAVLLDPDIELVVNLTVPTAHFDVSCRILNAGKHVYSEKPLCASLQDAVKLIDLANERGLRVGGAPDTFLGASHQAAREAIDNGVIGTVLSGSLSVLSRGMESWHPNPDFFFRTGGGPVLDLGPYYLAQLVNLLGPVKEVFASASTGFGTRTIGSGPRAGEVIPVETPTSYSAILSHHNGARITFEASWDVLTHRRMPIELYGTLGSLSVPDPNFFGDILSVSVQHADWEPIDISSYAFGAPNRLLRSGKSVADYRSIGVIDMVAAIHQGRPHRANGELALHVLEVLEAITLSATERRIVKIFSSCARPDPVPCGADEGVFLAEARFRTG
ncbi:gfo/Idh/MocA family oxidoreductase [Rhizobium leguminosarum bv. viciae]|uniref:Gfo/Idh/MocA family protein n=1 Tax=Rhizobium leguminosarum TaxID=384 RepID=UPI001441A908|nr:Gfo/Idh/MocA family oxidoreductase [Rhizobium leguminosarum]NKK04049.1 gfo/Idh/MocA family oxidoreductase [Rhizobium leguminosarum bv. viciae]